MKERFTIAFLLLILQSAFASAQTKRNSISVELGKSTLIGGLAYDHQFSQQETGLRVFTGLNLSNYRKAFTAGVGAYYLMGARQDFLELGTDLGYLYTGSSTQSENKPLLNYPDFATETFIASFNLGYRYKGSRFIFRIGLAPFIIKEGIYPGAYLSVGSLLC